MQAVASVSTPTFPAATELYTRQPLLRVGVGYSNLKEQEMAEQNRPKIHGYEVPDRQILITLTESEAGVVEGILRETLEGLEGVDTERMVLAKELIRKVLAKLPGTVEELMSLS